MNERSTGDSDVSPHELSLTESKSQTSGVPPTTQQNESSALVRSSIAGKRGSVYAGVSLHIEKHSFSKPHQNSVNETNVPPT